MPDQITDQLTDQTTEPTQATPKRYQCRHIFTDGHRCGSPCLRQEQLCYYHHTTRRPIENPGERRARQSTFELPLPEDRSAIQRAIGEVLQRIAANEIDPKRAGLLLYGLQIASLNLPKTPEIKFEPVEEIVTDTPYGTLAPQTEVVEEQKRPSLIAQLLEHLKQSQQPQSQETQPQPEELWWEKPKATAPSPDPEPSINDSQPQSEEPEPITLPQIQASAPIRSRYLQLRAAKSPAVAGLLPNQGTGLWADQLRCVTV
jgi:hypothetical protein